MQIVCPNCATAYQLDPATMGQAGRSVRCVRCRTVWFAANTAALGDIAEAHRAEMAQFIAAASMADAGADAAAATDSPAYDETAFTPVPSEATGADDSELAAAMAGSPVPGGFGTPAASDGPMAMVDSPPLAPIEPGDAGKENAGKEITEPKDVETVALRRSSRSKSRRTTLRLPGWRSLIVALIVVHVGLIGWRTDVVRFAPQTAPLYAAIGLAVNVRGLVFADVRSETQTQAGMHVLLVQGTIVSTAPRTVEVPRLRFAIRNEAGNEIYNWTALPTRGVLGPGDTLAFQSRLASPPPETKDVLVRFVTRRDGAGIQ
jgi:predicted Zn finger-like uncharacterized protein